MKIQRSMRKTCSNSIYQILCDKKRKALPHGYEQGITEDSEPVNTNPRMNYEDLTNVEQLEMEELDLKWHNASYALLED
ncbi:hypothetical protein Tco_0997290 [Tanacetum coccineum]